MKLQLLQEHLQQLAVIVPNPWVALGRLTLSGDHTSMRFLFAFCASVSEIGNYANRPHCSVDRSKIRRMKAFRSGGKANEFLVDVRPRTHPLLLPCLFSFVLALNAFAQQAPPKIEVGGRLHTFGESLRERNVELTEIGAAGGFEEFGCRREISIGHEAC
jgi:hypothetical protein